MIFRSSIIYAFNNESDQVLKIGTFTLIIYSISYPTYGYQMIIGNFFIAIGETKRGGLLSLGKGLLYIFYSFLMGQFFGLTGLILAQLCTDLTGTIITAVTYYTYRKKQLY